MTPSGPDMATSGVPQLKTQLRQQKARAAGKANLFKGGPIPDENLDDYDSEDLTEEQKKQKKQLALKRKNTIEIDFGGGKKPQPTTTVVVQNNAKKPTSLRKLAEYSQESFTAPGEIVFKDNSFYQGGDTDD